MDGPAACKSASVCTEHCSDSPVSGRALSLQGRMELAALPWLVFSLDYPSRFSPTRCLNCFLGLFLRACHHLPGGAGGS